MKVLSAASVQLGKQRCGQKTWLVEWPVTPGRVKRAKGWGLPQGSQAFQFLNLFLHVQPVKRKHPVKYLDRECNFMGSWNEVFPFSLVLPLKAGTEWLLFAVKPVFTCALLTVILCITSNYTGKKNACIPRRLFVRSTKLIRSSMWVMIMGQLLRTDRSQWHPRSQTRCRNKGLNV